MSFLSGVEPSFSFMAKRSVTISFAMLGLLSISRYFKIDWTYPMTLPIPVLSFTVGATRYLKKAVLVIALIQTWFNFSSRMGMNS